MIGLWASMAVRAADFGDGPLTGSVDGDLLLGGGYLAGDDAPGQAGYFRSRAPAFQQDLLVRGGADWAVDGVWTLRAHATLRVDELRRATPPEEPDADDPVRSASIAAERDGWGEFQIGHIADARVQQGYWAPQICDCLDGLFGTNTPQIGFNAGPIGNNSTTVNLDGRAVKLLWLGPDWHGFQLSLSAAPESEEGYRINPRADELARPREARLERFWSASIVWQHEFGETNLGLAGGVSGASRAGTGLVRGRNDADPVIWDAGFQLGYAAWKWGAGFEQQNAIAADGAYGAAAFVESPNGGFLPPQSNRLINRTVDVGSTYAIGPVLLGVAWSRGFREGVADPLAPKRISANDTVFAGLSWSVSSSVKLIGALQWNGYDPGGGYRALPSAAGLNQSFGGTDQTLNIWGKSYGAAGIVIGARVGL